MRQINLGGGAVAFELEGTKDRIENLDPDKLLQSGWSEQAVGNYFEYFASCETLFQKLRQNSQQSRENSGSPSKPWGE